MKSSVLILLSALALGGNIAHAQDVDYNKIVLPGNAVDVSIEERLVQLAWRNNPINRNIVKTAQLSDYELKKAKWAWMDYFGVRGNLNEFTLNPSRDIDGRASFYPRYNLSAVITLGTLGTNSLEVKKKRVEKSIAEDRVNAAKLAVRADILTLYTRYNLVKEKLKLQTDIEQESYANLRLTEENFKKGTDNVITYNNALERHTGHKLRKMEAEADLKLLKIQLEEMIGVKLETVMN